MAYIGHNCCAITEDYSGNKIHSQPASGAVHHGLAVKEIGLCVITNRLSESSETKTMIHEFNHFYGVPDHYGYDTQTTDEIKESSGNNGYNEYCIHGEKKEDLAALSNYTICKGCKDVIKSNMGLYDHN